MTGRKAEAPRRLAEGDSPQAALLRAAERGTEAPAGARDRVWRALHAPRATRFTWKLALPLGAGALAAAAALLVAIRPAPELPVGAVAESTGPVEIASADGAPLPSAAGAELPPRADVRVGQGGEAVLRVGEARAALAGGSAARLGRKGELTLSRGMAAISISRASVRVVFAAGYFIEATSAVFVVRLDAPRAQVQVREGAVRVRGPAGTVELGSGASWSNAGTADAPGERERNLAERAAGRKLAEAAPAPVMIVAPPPVALAAQPPAPAPVPPRKRVLLARAPKAAEPAPVETEEQMHGRAHALERDGRHSEAADLYAELARRPGPRAEPALYELARLRHRFLGRSDEALAALDEYQRRFPHGALSLEAALTAVEARVALGGGEPALRAMDDFLGRFGSSERAPDVRWLRASLLADRGECARAIPDLRALAAAGAHAGDAVFALASCARGSGDLPEARARLEEYLRRFPDGRRRAEAETALRGH